jgi:hypothetical protein
MSASLQELEASVEEKFDYSGLVDAMRCHSSDWLKNYVAECRREQQRWWLQELAATRVLDDREALGPFPDGTQSARTNRQNLKVARELESLPKIAEAAHAGDISKDQLEPLVEIATSDTDGEWSQRGRRMSPGDLDRMARARQRVTAADAAARHEARGIHTWRNSEKGMAGGRWALPDVDGVLVEKVLDHMAERMRPSKGMKWDSLAHRKADALMQLVREYADVEPTGRFRYEIVNLHDPNAKSFGASVDGIPIADETLAALLPNAKVRECVPDENGVMRTVKRPRQALPKDIERHIRRRDVSCRCGCGETRYLDIHHMEPILSFGESWDVHKLALISRFHHSLLEPHGPYRLIGDAEQPGDLQLVHRDDLARDGPDPPDL